MTWIDDLRDDARHRQDVAASLSVFRYALAPTDEMLARADTLVRTLLDQMNQVLLEGRGSVWDAPARWGVHLWELWWEQTREGGSYLVVTLLRDSRGAPYLKVQGRRLALDDARLEHRLQRALRAAFLEPRAYTPRARVVAGARELPRPVSLDIERTERRLPHLLPDIPPPHVGAEPSGSAAEPGGRTSRPRRRGRHDEGGDA